MSINEAASSSTRPQGQQSSQQAQPRQASPIAIMQPKSLKIKKPKVFKKNNLSCAFS